MLQKGSEYKWKDERTSRSKPSSQDRWTEHDRIRKRDKWHALNNKKVEANEINQNAEIELEHNTYQRWSSNPVPRSLVVSCQ
jgi:hypothetical protein